MGGNDTLRGGAGAEVLKGGAGADVLNGSTGRDRVSYADASGRIYANLNYGRGYWSDAQGDTYSRSLIHIGSRRNAKQ